MSIVAVIAAATILALPGILSNPVLGSSGQSSTNNSSSISSSSSSSARNDYKNFRTVFLMQREQKDMLQKRK
jgi:hypothetical protein